MTVDQLTLMASAHDKIRREKMVDDALVLKASISASLSEEGFRYWKDLIETLQK